MKPLAPGTTLVDLEYLGRPGHIATCFLETSDGLALVDPGPATTVIRLRQAIERFGATMQDVRVLLLTHIHLDHAGVAGILARELPRLRIHVHERGAEHLADPTRLLRSATMIYGDQMDRLWGEVLPVPAESIHPVAGGERLSFGGRAITVGYTPGHAWHHVSFLDEGSGIAFTGDVVGEQPPGSSMPLPVTPPPDIDVELMVESGHRILAWRPARLFVTHFGPVDAPAEFVRLHEARLRQWSLEVRDSLDQPGPDEERRARFADRAHPQLLREFPHASHEYLPRETLEGNWVGLARYWRTRDTGTSGA